MKTGSVPKISGGCNPGGSAASASESPCPMMNRWFALLGFLMLGIVADLLIIFLCSQSASAASPCLSLLISGGDRANVSQYTAAAGPGTNEAAPANLAMIK
jgi:hypothetical protein